MKQVLTDYKRLFLFLFSLFITAFGQPAGIAWLTIPAYLFGFGIFCYLLLDVPLKSGRFWLGTLWFTAIQAIQLHWMLSHPYNYIFLVHAAFSFMWGLQWGFLSLFVTPQNFHSLRKLFALACLWTLMEWSRLFFMSGYTWNPVGLALTEFVYPMQLASIGGIFLLSFWVIFVNLTVLKAWLNYPKKLPVLLCTMLAITPFIFGIYHLQKHENDFAKINDQKEPFRALLTQTAFPAEEAMEFTNKASYISFVLDEWTKIFEILQPYQQKHVDLIALPEYVVPFGTYTYLYPYENVKARILSIYGSKAEKWLPPLEHPFATPYQTADTQTWFVNNAFWVQTLANIFNTEVIAGLEDAEWHGENRKHYSAAIHFKPHVTAESFEINRYAKRILLPMAEYIPSSLLRDLAAQYGIKSSFTCGEEATIFQGNKLPFGVSICYEETFGNLMREARCNGAELLVNLTSDVWYPSSTLPKQHLDHAKLRSVENGFPVVRACNTGVTSAYDSFGRQVSELGDGSIESQWVADALYVEVPRYHYDTLYSRFGDLPVILLCCLALLLLI